MGIVEILNDPHLVARVQELFGVRLIGVVKDDNETSDNQVKQRSVRTVKMLENKKCLYQINNLFFYYFFQFITRVGNEIFYIMFLPGMAWFYDERIGYLTTLSWSLMMYMGQAAKDIIKLPRPQTPPVVKMEDRYLLEYGFPSTHSMAILNISVTLTILIYREMIQTDQFDLFQFGIVATVASLFTFFVCLSRVYLGMHSFLDITGGLVFSLTYSLIYLRFTDQIFWFISHGILAAIVQVMLVVVVCLNYPARERWSPARADTFLIMGVTVGISLAVGLKTTLNIFSLAKINYKTQQVTLIRLVARFLLGIVPVVLVRFISKILFSTYVRQVYSLPAGTSSDSIKELIKSNFRLEIFYYLFCYGCISFTCLGFSFPLFYLFGV